MTTRRLIIDGSTEKDLGSRTIRLLNPAASVALLRLEQAASEGESRG